jgi:hypothetical protein
MAGHGQVGKACSHYEWHGVLHRAAGHMDTQLLAGQLL